MTQKLDAAHPLKSLMHLLSPYRWQVALSFILYGFKHSPVWLLPVITADVIDILVSGRSLDDLWRNAFFFALLLGQNLPMNIWFTMTLSKVLRAIEIRLRTWLSVRAQEMTIDAWNRMNVGALQSKVVRDVENVELALRQAGNAGFAAVFNFVGAVTVTALKVPEFLIFFLLVVPTSGWVVVFTRKKLNARNEAFRNDVEGMAIATSEMMTLVPVARAHGLENQALHKVSQSFENTRSSGLKLDFVNSSFGALSWVVFHISNGICLITAVWAGRTGRIDISPGEVVMLTGYFGVLASAVIMLTDLAPSLTRGIASLKSVAETLNEVEIEENSGKLQVQNLGGEVEFRNVYFSYNESDSPAVQDFSLTVKPDSVIALVGMSGSGKTTLASLLIGFVRPQAGQILFDGEDAANLDYRSIRSHISVVPQEAVMFDGTVAENVTYGLPGASSEQLIDALTAANAMEFVEQLPDGVETPIGPRGFTLSGGQKQRIAIARALIRNPKILILDEATSALDNESEFLVQQALTELMKGRTTFVIAHRLSTIRDADCIVVMDSGRILEQGTHQELVALDGHYARLATMNDVLN